MFPGEQVHGSAAPLAAACLLAEQLTHHFSGWNACAEGVDVIAVGAAKPVVLTLHGTDHTGAHSLLAVVEVNETEHFAAVIHFRALVLEAASEGHVSEQLKPGLPVHRCPLGCHQGREPFGMGSEKRLSIGGRGAACLRADCDVLTHGTTCLTIDFKGPRRIDGQNPRHCLQSAANSSNAGGPSHRPFPSAGG